MPQKPKQTCGYLLASSRVTGKHCIWLSSDCVSACLCVGFKKLVQYSLTAKTCNSKHVSFIHNWLMFCTIPIAPADDVVTLNSAYSTGLHPLVASIVTRRHCIAVTLTLSTTTCSVQPKVCNSLNERFVLPFVSVFA